MYRHLSCVVASISFVSSLSSAQGEVTAISLRQHMETHIIVVRPGVTVYGDGSFTNTAFPPVNHIIDIVPYSPRSTGYVTLEQKITKYEGPLAENATAPGLAVDGYVDAELWGGGTAESYFTLRFSLDQAHPYSLVRPDPFYDLYFDFNKISGPFAQIAAGTGILSPGTYELFATARIDVRTAFSLTVFPVPEPGAGVVLGLPALFLGRRRWSPARASTNSATT